MDRAPIIAALDLTPGSAPAVVRAADVARRAGADLHLLHADVLHHAGEAGPAPPAVPDASPSNALRVRVERFAAEALGLDPVALDELGPTVAVVRGVAAPAAVLRYAVDVGAALLVLGTHGRGGLRRLLLGSVAEACVAAASCPVLTVSPRAGDRAPEPDAPVLVAVDFSEWSAAALTAAHQLAALYDAPVELVHAVRDAGPYAPFAEDGLPVYDVDLEAVRERLRTFAEATAGPPPAAVHVAYGAPSRVVPDLAAQREAGAIVLGTHGRTGLAQALLGSVAEAVFRQAPCPVLTLRAAPFALRPAPSSLAS